MDIEWIRQSCFRLRAAGAVIVTDPFDEAGGYLAGYPEADVVTLSHLSSQDKAVDRLQARRRVLRGPGEYEIANVFFTAIKTFRDGEKGATRGPNIVYRFKMDGVLVCHLGALGHVPTTEHASALGDVDLLLVPVGGLTLTPAQASETVGLLEPKVVIPMPQEAAKAGASPPSIAAFLKELGVPAPEAVAKLSLSASSLPAEGPRVALLTRAS